MSANHFELFGLPQRHALDLAELASRQRALLQSLHPDRHINASASERRLAEQYAADCNEALRVLVDPLLRAAYILRLRGADPFEETATAALPVDFLERQLELHEQLDEIETSHDSAAAATLAIMLAAEVAAELQALGAALDGDNCELAAAVAAARRLRYLSNCQAKAAGLVAD